MTEENLDYDLPSKTFDGVEYHYNPLMAKAAREKLVQLINKFGPVFGKGIKQLNRVDNVDGVLDTEVGIELLPVLAGSLGEMIVKFSEAVSPGFYVDLTDIFLQRVSMATEEGGRIRLKKDVREAMFGRKLLLEARLLVWCLEEQYSDFFALWKLEAMQHLAKLLAKAKNSGFPNQSTGGSTE